MNGGFGGISSGGGGGGGAASDFLRFFALDLNLLIVLELGSAASDSGGILLARGDTGAGGGEHEGSEEGGEMDVTSTMSTDGERERARLSEEFELGDGESSGAGGGGKTKWNVREAICICDLEKGRPLCKEDERQ